MKAFKPRGVTIWQRRPDRFGRAYPLLVTIKSRGRTGAAIRQRLQSLTVEQQQPILSAWLCGQAADFPGEVAA